MNPEILNELYAGAGEGVGDPTVIKQKMRQAASRLFEERTRRRFGFGSRFRFRSRSRRRHRSGR